MLAVAVPQRLEARLVRLIDVTALGLPTLHAVSVCPTTPMSTSALKVTSSVALTVAQALFLPPSSSGLFSCFLFLWPFFLSATSSSALSHAVFPWLPLSQATFAISHDAVLCTNSRAVLGSLHIHSHCSSFCSACVMELGSTYVPSSACETPDCQCSIYSCQC